MSLQLIPVLLAAALAVACGSVGPSPVAAPARPVAQPLADDTSLATASGTTFRAPRGWWLEWIGPGRDAVRLQDPDRALSLFLVEVAGTDAVAAIGAAWQRARPGFALAAGDADTPPPSGGWEAIASVAYPTPDAEHRTVTARAQRLGATTWVALLYGDAAAVARREAQIDTVIGSLAPPGLHEESFAGRAPRDLDAERVRELDAFIAAALARLAVPGAAVAVIHGDRVVYERTFGVRELGQAAPVTAQTLFLMASITKPMTTLMQARLVDAGVLTWDAPVSRLLPGFALGDAEVTRKLLLWHMSCACTGMPRQDLEDLFEYGAITPEQRLASMKTMRPTTGFGETFQYSNLMVAAGGFAAAHAFAPASSLGDAYAAALRAMVFDPIGMTSSTVDIAAAERADHASPHALDLDGAPRAMPVAIERGVLPIAPAGAVWSNLRDMERLAMTELALGVAPGGKRVVSERNLRERRIVRVTSGDGSGYGLGLDVSRYHGLSAIGHDGGAFGFGTMLFLLPDQGLGIVVLTNVRNGGGYQQLPFNAAVQRKIVEQLFAGARDVAGPSVAYYAKARRAAAQRAAANVERAPERAWLARLAGTYHNASLGTVTVGEDATFDAGEWRTRFGRRVDQDGTRHLVFLDPPFAGSGPTVGGDDAHPTLVIDAGQARHVFTRAAP